MIDLFVTTFKRPELCKKSLRSLLDNTNRDLFRLTLIVDGDAELETLAGLLKEASPHHTLLHRENLGLGPSINQALAHINTLNTYYKGEKEENKYICYCQDDVEYQKGWLEKLVKIYNLYHKKYNVGFVSGHNAPEHEVKGTIKFGKDTLLLKPWIRATNMFTTAEYFMSMFPISRMDPETGRVRAKPNNGMGSGVDWWFIRNHENSVCRTGRMNIVVPGLIKHIGYNESTWLDRELPEDDR
jgi:glycosyltransferase involved in cell wall biosynthesis